MFEQCNGTAAASVPPDNSVVNNDETKHYACEGDGDTVFSDQLEWMGTIDSKACWCRRGKYVTVGIESGIEDVYGVGGRDRVSCQVHGTSSSVPQRSSLTSGPASHELKIAAGMDSNLVD
jgi:hypothetical protein